MDPRCAEIRVRYADTDQMGVTYYANYLVWMEVGRTEYLRNIGITYRDLETVEGIILPVKEAFIDYKASAHYDDIVVVRSTIDEFTRAHMKISYELRLKDDGKLLATGYTVHPFLNREKKITRIPVALFEKIQGAMG
ncbi:MAG: thioesterase family protein [Spirochaetota bacterium]|mgnify:CR=1 FL=1